jgi:hypothetical protein
LPEPLINLGVLLQYSGRLQEAEAIFQQVLQIDPAYIDALESLGYLHLLMGDFERGWVGYENRWKGTQNRQDHCFSQPRWDGQAFPHQTLLVYAEQGLGDNVQMFRYLPKLAAMGGRVILECPPGLFRLFQENTPRGVSILKPDETPTDFDRHCPDMSLPLLFQTRLETIPNDIPYLHPPAEAVQACPVLPAAANGTRMVGLVWAGNPMHKNDHNRSMDFDRLGPLFDIPGITWVILQQERRPTGFADTVRQRGWLDPMGAVRDFADTAAIIDALDLVIGVDTAVMHLAGAMGKPAWLLLPMVPDWRWLMQGQDSPWYPSLRLFRQKTHNGWADVIQRVADALGSLPHADE